MIYFWRPGDHRASDKLRANPWPSIEFILRGSYVEEGANTSMLELGLERGYGVHRTVRPWKRWSIHRTPTCVARRIIHADQGTVVLVARWFRTSTPRVYA